MSQAGRYIPQYTLADYERWEGDWELWDGVPVAMSPAPTFRHQQMATRLIAAINQALAAQTTCHCEAVADVDWRVSDTTVVRPDVIVVCEPPENDFLVQPPTLIAEILSPSTAGKDRVYKRELYASQGVHYYLIVDQENNAFEALRLNGVNYESTDMQDIALHEGCRIALEPAKIFTP